MSLSFDLMGIVHTELLKILPEDAYKRSNFLYFMWDSVLEES